MQTGRPVHSFSSYPSYLLPGDSIAKYFNTRRDGGSWDDLAPLRPPFSSPPLPSFASSCTTRVCHMARTFHPLSRKGIRANDHRDTNQGEARDRSFSSSSSSFSSSSSSFEASIRTTLVMILESHVFPFKFKEHFYFFCRMERRVVSFFLYLFLQRYRGSRVTKK